MALPTGYDLPEDFPGSQSYRSSSGYTEENKAVISTPGATMSGVSWMDLPGTCKSRIELVSCYFLALLADSIGLIMP
jgi:hypothetical protein